jgi:diadenosine tetraphosphate (Ap4A) HIT family hydrolase
MSTPLSRVDCELCASDGGDVAWRDARCRVVLVNDADYPGYCRVIWQSHTAEMSDLGPQERFHLMRVVLEVEAGLREWLRPDKVNLASLGNVVPHLHWHVIPRFRDDPHFPGPIWGGGPRRPPPGAQLRSRGREAVACRPSGVSHRESARILET